MEALLPALPDGALNAADAAALEAHLAVCPSCRAEAGATFRLAEAVRADPLPGVSLPGGSQAVSWILQQDAVRTAHRSWHRLAWAPGLAVATVAVTALLVVGAPRGPRAVQPDPTSSVALMQPSAQEPLPALVVVDDERTGRQVMLIPAPSPPSGEDAGTGAL